MAKQLRRCLHNSVLARPSALVFSGQGTQHPGMCASIARDFPRARQVLEEIDESLGFKLSKLMAEGPENDLRRTENAQPAIFAHSMAVLRVLRDECDVEASSFKAMMGHSLGEYSALVAAGSLSVSTGAILVRHRGQAMAAVSNPEVQAMAAVAGGTLEAVNEAVEAAALQGHGVAVVANINSSKQLVISGERTAVEAAVSHAKKAGVRRALMLPVGGAFHSPLMAPAAQVMADALAAVEIRAPVVPVIANVTGKQVQNVEEIKKLLVEQITAPVQWQSSVEWCLDNNIRSFIEIGPKPVLGSLIRQTDSCAYVEAYTTSEDLTGAIKETKRLQ